MSENLIFTNTAVSTHRGATRRNYLGGSKERFLAANC